MRTKTSVSIALCLLALTGCSTDPGTGPGTDGGGDPRIDGGGDPIVDGGGAPIDGGGAPLDGGGTPAGWRAIALAEELDERITGIYCTGPRACVVSTAPFGEEGHIYATDGRTITGTLLTGDAAFAEAIGTLGTVGFLGFSRVGDRLIAHVGGAGAGLVSATGDVTQASSWTSTIIGIDGDGTFGLNAQLGFGSAGSRFTYLSANRIFETTDAPGPGASWSMIWSPQAVPPRPADIDAQRAADPTICNTDPGVQISPPLTQTMHIAADASLIVSPAGAVNQDGDDSPGVCISTDGGHLFHHAAFAGVEDGAGPVGVACTSRDHCVAYGGISSNPGSAFVFVSTNASMGASSTWTRATVPTFVDDTLLRSAFFAPDGTTGWIVGAAGSGAPLLLTTTDGGATWTDITSSIRALAPGVRLHTGYAFDATHLWIGGEHDVLLTIGD